PAANLRVRSKVAAASVSGSLDPSPSIAIMLAAQKSTTPFGTSPTASDVANPVAFAHLLLSEHCRSEQEFPLRALEAVCRSFPVVAARVWTRAEDGSHKLVAHSGLEVPSPIAVSLRNAPASHRASATSSCRVAPVTDI